MSSFLSLSCKFDQISLTHFSFLDLHCSCSVQATICQREHPFYIDTVRGFRDRRYEYKDLNKKWGKKLSEAVSAIDIATCKDMILLYDSMQLAHKCILNSFYGYVMRKGARWCSMPMAGVVTKTGASIIQCATDLVMAVGRPLELDTDGIWCVIPERFPDNYTLESKDPVTGAVKKVFLNYPCSVLNRVVNLGFSNHQYQTLDDEAKRTYTMSSECSIMFEVDGPYRAMVLPASQHEGKNIKKRYAVFNKDGSLAELKGFEIKRRGELKLIKIYQGEVFKTFLNGDSLEDCYKHVGAVGDRWLDVLYTKGADISDHDLFDLISENKSMSDTLESYGDARSTSITCARRLGEFLGAEMVKDKGLNCKFIVSRMPAGAPVSERAVPVVIFSAEPAIQRQYLRKWLKDNSLTDFDLRNLLDWEYYITRLGSAIQKIVTIPAAFQGVANPCPRVAHPEWLDKALRRKRDKSKQTSLKGYFTALTDSASASKSNGGDNSDGDGDDDGGSVVDIEDDDEAHGGSGEGKSKSKSSGLTRVTRRHRNTAGGSNGGLIMADGDGGDDGEDDEERKEAVADRRRRQAFASLIEDDPFDTNATGSSGGSSAKAGSTAATSKKQQERADLAAAALTLAGPKPDIQKDYKAWLQWQKALWREQRRDRAARETALLGAPLQLQAGAGAAAAVRLGGRGMKGYVEEAEQAAASPYWQILEAMPSPTVPGRFDVWVLANSKLELISVTVPRTFYLNTHIENAMGEATGKRVDRVLPRGRPCRYLYEITVEEGEFLRDYKEVQDFTHEPSVEGLYETRVPLDFTFVLTAGAVCLPKRIPGREAFERRKEFTLEQLVPYNVSPMAPVAAAGLNAFTPYLTDIELNKVFLYHISATAPVSGAAAAQQPQQQQQQRHVWAVLPANGTKGLVVTVGPGAERVNHKQLYLAACEAVGAPFDPTAEFAVAQQAAPTVAAALDLVKAALLRCKSEAGAVPSVVLAQTAETRAQLAADLPMLRTEFPVVMIHSSGLAVGASGDGADGGNGELPLLQWATAACKRMYSSLLAATAWWRERLATAQRANVPVGNCPADHSMFALDVCYARALRQVRQLSISSLFLSCYISNQCFFFLHLLQS